MTGGIVDVAGLYDCLIGICDSKANLSILDRYSDIRREKYLTMVDPVSSENLRRLFDQDSDAALEKNDLLKLCKRTEDDPALLKKVVLGGNALRYDFTQDYTTCPKV